MSAPAAFAFLHVFLPLVPGQDHLFVGIAYRLQGYGALENIALQDLVVIVIERHGLTLFGHPLA